jgi:hypothetical protein
MSQEINDRLSDLEMMADIHDDCITHLYSLVGAKEEIVYTYTINYKLPETVSTWSGTL